MTIPEKYDRIITGVVSGLILPFVTGIIIFLFSSYKYNLHSYLVRIAESHIITHSISLCVFPNVLLFLLFNRFDMLHASRGVLGITIFWAAIVFSVKLFA